LGCDSGSERTCRFFLGRMLSVPSQSVIGEINLLMIMIPGRGRTFSSGVLVPFSENGFSKKFVSPPQN
jgi:hypothetical protein